MNPPRPESTDGRDRANAYSSPLVWHLSAAVLGLSAAAAWEATSRKYGTDFLSAALFFWLAALSIKFSFGERGAPFASCAAVFGTFLFSTFYLQARERANPYPNLAPREAQLTARICDVSRGANNSRYGIAEIVDAPSFARLAVGMRLWYVVSDGKKGGGKCTANLSPSQIVRFDGVFGGLNISSFKSRGFFAGDEKNTAFEDYLQARRIFFKIRTKVAGVEVLTPPTRPIKFFEAARGYMEKSLTENFSFFPPDSEATRTYIAMMLGDKSLLTPEQKESFADTGVMHVFAISGLHVGFAAALLLEFCSLARINWRLSPFLCLPVLFVYVCACGARPSAMRAFGMVAVVWLALSLGRRIKVFDALVLAAVVSLAVSPVQLFDTGWTLSYAVVASIFLYGAPLFSLFDRYWRKIFAKKSSGGKYATERMSESLTVRILRNSGATLLGGFCISLGAMFAAAPLSAHSFGYVAPLSVIYSPFFVLGAGIAVSLGFIGFALPFFLAKFTNATACAAVWSMSNFACEGVGLFNPAVDIKLSNSAATLAAIGSFLFLSAALEKFPRLAARFVLAPLPSLFILTYAFLF